MKKKNNMRVAVFTPVFWPYRGGIGRVVENEAEVLRELGCEVDIYTPRYVMNWPQKEKRRTVDIKRFKPIFKFGNAAWIAGDLNLVNYDILHLHYPFIGGVRAVLRLKKRYDKPLIVTYHMDLLSQGWRGIFFKIYSWIVLPKIVKVADKIIFSSFDYGKHSFLVKYWKQYINKFIEIPFGVKVDEKEMTRNEAKKQLSWEDNKKTILFVGALDKAHYFKGLKILFSAIKKFRRIEQNFKLVIVGGGERLAFYKKLSQKMGISDCTEFVGGVGDEELSAYYKAADVLVLPSLGASEAYGMVLLEAEVRGTPVIASDLPGVRGQVVEGAGKLFRTGDFNDLAQNFLDFFGKNEEETQKRREAAENWAKQSRTLFGEAEKLLAVYKSVVDPN